MKLTPNFEFALPRGRRWTIRPRPGILGIVNVTPDSFSDGGVYATADDAVRAGLGMLRDGADALDIGGESTRPGSDAVPAEEQLRRVLPVLEALRGETDAPISVDTRDPSVGEALLDAGADIINDVSGCRDPRWIEVLRGRDVPVILMHMRGTPADMQNHTHYPKGVTTEVVEFLSERLTTLTDAGLSRERFFVDPGIGFAKKPAQNLEILRELGKLRDLGRPVLLGVSRKSFLGKVLHQTKRGTPRDRDVATVVANAFALMRGVSVLRVHNVPYTRDLVNVFQALALSAEDIGVEPCRN